VKFFEDPLRARLARNTAYNAAASAVGLLSAILLSALLLKDLGVERFGLWSLLWALSGSLALLDTRLGAAITPLTAESRAKGEGRGTGRLLSACTIFYLSLGLLELSLAAAAVRIPALARWLPEAVRQEARSAFLGAVAVLAVNSLSAGFLGFLQGFERYDQTGRLTIGVHLSRLAALSTVALHGGGLPALMAAELAMTVAQAGASGLMASRELRNAGGWALPDRAAFRRLLSFGSRVQVAHVAQAIMQHGDKILLSAFLDLSSVAYYDLGSKIANAMRSGPLLLVSATTPVASALASTGDKERLSRLYVKGTRALFLAAAPLWMGVMLFAPLLIRLWTHVTAPQAAWAARILSTGYLANLLSGMAYSASLGLGRPDMEMKRSLLMTVVNPALSAGLILALGAGGAPLGTAISLVIGSGYLMSTVQTALGRRWGDLIR
jgi:O-antigen/teichoic acid export membrane protein